MASSVATAVLFLLIVTAAAASTPNNRHAPFKKIFAFGDSFTDTGNTLPGKGPIAYGEPSSRPYGMAYFHRPANRYSDGRIVIDFVSEFLNLPFLPPYRTPPRRANFSQGVNFAVSGSTAINHAFFVKNNMILARTPESIETQFLWFNRHMETLGCGEPPSSPECTKMLDDSLFWVGEIGVNDYAYNMGLRIPDETIRKLAISSITRFIRSLLKKGAKYMVVQGPPPTGCLTLTLKLAYKGTYDSFGCNDLFNNRTLTHSLLLQSRLQQLRKEFPDATIVYADFWNAYRTVLNNAEKYGFNKLIRTCCGAGGGPYNFLAFQTCGKLLTTVCRNPKRYINWDGVHLTEAMYKVVSDMFLSGNYTKPSFASLLSKKQSQG